MSSFQCMGMPGLSAVIGQTDSGLSASAPWPFLDIDWEYALANRDANEETSGHEYRPVWRYLRPGPPRASRAGAGGAGALQSFPRSLRTCQCSATQAAPALVGLCTPLCHDCSGHDTRERLCAFATRSAGRL